MVALLRSPLGFRNEFDHLRDVSALIIVSAFGTLLIAVLYVSVYRIGGLVPEQDFQRAAIRFWIGDWIGIVTTAPLLLLLGDWARMAQGLRKWRWGEIAAQFCTVILTLWVIFGLKWADEFKLFYLLFLPLIWIVVRHGIVGAAIGITVIQLGLMTAVEVSGYRAAAVLEFQFLMRALATTGLFHGIYVTERRAARKALNSSESRLRAIVSTAPDSIVTVDGSGTIVAANPAASRIFGCAVSKLIGTRVCEVLPEFEHVARLGEVTEVVGIRCNGSRFPAELAVGTTSGGAPELHIAITRDITHRREIERQLGEKQAELNRTARLAAAGEMAAALAHELHQPLSAIRNYARASQMLMHSTASDELMNKVEHEAARAADVVQRLRDFFRGGASRLERISVRRLIEGALEPMREGSMRHHITLDTAITNDDVELLVDRVQIETVLHSLVGNAIEAIASTSGGERRIRVAATGADSGWVRLSVVDSGPGINPAIVDRLFEPFTTTKPTGIGLGLAMSRSMVEAHGGELEAEPSAGGGTVFHFSLPTADLKEATYDRE
jgi:PAS domain S-box-containing protein